MCFSVGWIVQLLVMLVVICLIVGLVRIWLVPMVADPRIVQTVNWIIWAVVVIFIIYVCADLLICAFSGGFGLGYPSQRLR